MAEINRLSVLCDQTALTGIDFIQVVEPLVQTRLRVFFVVEPALLDVPMVAPAALTAPAPGAAAGPPEAAVGLVVTIVSNEGGSPVEITGLDWRIVRAPAGNRVALEVAVAAPGDFSIYRLSIDDARVDPFFNDVEFSFKQGCPSVFDCRDDCEPEPIESRDYNVDYLARDFWSLRRALLDFASERQPQWSESLEADEAVMLMEIMAALGDEFAYTQDRIAREATLESATQRRSRSSLARLVDYFPDPGLAAVTELAVWVAAGGGGAEAIVDTTAWAFPEGRPAVPFSVLEPVWHHEAWNEIPLHCPDSGVACLPAGATEAFLLTDAPTVAQLQPGEPLAPADFWVGRRAILRSRPSDPAEPERAFAVTITGVEPLVDQLAPDPGVPTVIARITWSEPTPWPLLLSETSALLNVVAVAAGKRETELFRAGSDQAAVDYATVALQPDQVATLLALPRAVEREGPFDEERGGRNRLLRYGLRASKRDGLGWIRPEDAHGLEGERQREPRLTVREVFAPTYLPAVGGPAWEFFRDILGSDLDTNAFTLEEGMWSEVVTHQTPFEDVVFEDYSGDEGWTVRFGDGAFGRPPEDGSVLEVSYHTAPGSAANLPPDSVVHLTPPPGGGGQLFGYASAITNPLLISSGSDEETPESVRINAPELFRARPRRAVRPEDYSTILERLDWVQRANATTRWTGSWSTYFIAADPVDGFATTAEQRRALGSEIEAIRQVTRDARQIDPDYLDIDLEVDVCASREAYPGEVVERVTKELADPGFFAPDNFTFGQSLDRSGIESAVQCVPGVKGVEEIRLRVRRRRQWHVFAEPELTVEAWQIIRLQNDRQYPSRGSLLVRAHGGAA